MIFQATPHLPAGMSAGELERDLMIAATKVNLRRRWILRSSLTLLVTSAVLVLLVFLRADRTVIHEVLKSLDHSVRGLQTEIDALGQLPAVLPEATRGDLAYASPLVREYARQASESVIVASTASRSLVMQSNGNGVIIYQGQKVRREWVSGRQFLSAWQAQEARIKKWNQERRSAAPILP